MAKPQPIFIFKYLYKVLLIILYIFLPFSSFTAFASYNPASGTDNLDSVSDRGATTDQTLTTTGLRVSTDNTVGLGTSKGLIEFEDESIDNINLMNANVGIGTTQPTAKIELVGTGNGSGVALLVTDSTADSLLRIQNNGIMSFGFDNNRTYKVGIGTTAPTSALDVAQTIEAGSYISNGTAAGVNSMAIGNEVSGGDLIASVTGSFVFGYAQSGGGASSTISSAGAGAISGGFARDQGTTTSISAAGTGSIAFGNARRGTMSTSNDGAIAMGRVNTGTMLSSGDGSVALGRANSGTLQATGDGSVAIGENVQATMNNAVAIGESTIASAVTALAFGRDFTNSTTDSFQVGFGSAVLAVGATNAGIGTTAPAARLQVVNTGSSNASMILAVGTTSSSTGMFVTNAGRVGIGKTNPTQKLDVTGSIIASTNIATVDDAYDATNWNGNNNVPTKNAVRDKIEALGAGTDDLDDVADRGATTDQALTTAGLILSSGNTVGLVAGKGRIEFEDEGVDNVNITNANVGIGTTEPTAKLQIIGTGNSSAATAILVQDSTTTNLFAVMNNGYVGIGTTAPAAKLNVNGNVVIAGIPQEGGTSLSIATTTNEDVPEVGLDINLNGGYWQSIGSQISVSRQSSDVGFNNYLFGQRITVLNEGDGALGSNFTGQTIDMINTGDVDVSNIAGLDMRTEVSDGDIGVLQGFDVYMEISGTASVEERYGINIYPFVGSTTTSNDFSLYSGATQKSYFAGSLGIGNTAPTARLNITNTGVASSLQIDDYWTGKVAQDINSLQTTGAIIDIDATKLSTGKVVGVTIDDTYNDTGTGLVDITATAVDTTTSIPVLRIATTAANDVDVAAVTVARTGGNAAKILWDEGADTWMIDNGTNSPSAISTGGSDDLDDVADRGATTDQSLTTAGIIVSSDNTVGLGTGKGLIEFEDESIDNVNISNANVGIGTTQPTAKLQLVDTGSSNAAVALLVGASTTASNLVVTNAGNVGIGTSTPANPLSVVGNSSVSGTLTAGVLASTGAISAGSTISSYTGTNNPTWITFGSTAADVFDITRADGVGAYIRGGYGGLMFTTVAASGASAGTERMRITGTGLIGIGTDNPRTTLEVAGTVSIIHGGSNAGRLGIGTTGPTARIHIVATGSSNAALSVNVNTDDLIVTNAGRVGIGISAPTAQLEVSATIMGDKTIVFDGEYDNGTKNGAFTIDWNNGNKQKVTITGTDLDITFTNPRGVTNLLLKVVQDDGSDTIDWDNEADIKWNSGGTNPTLSTAAAALDIVSFYFDGTNYFGVASLDFQ